MYGQWVVVEKPWGGNDRGPFYWGIEQNHYLLYLVSSVMSQLGSVPKVSSKM